MIHWGSLRLRVAVAVFLAEGFLLVRMARLVRHCVCRRTSRRLVTIRLQLVCICRGS